MKPLFWVICYYSIMYVMIIKINNEKLIKLLSFLAIPCALTIQDSDPDYSFNAVIKFMFIILASIVIAYRLHSILRIVVAINILCIISSKIPFIINIMLLLLGIMTPKDMFNPPDIFVICYTIFILAHHCYSTNPGLKEHLILAIVGLIFACFMHFHHGNFIHTRAICLLSMIIFDRLDMKNTGL